MTDAKATSWLNVAVEQGATQTAKMAENNSTTASGESVDGVLTDMIVV